MPNWLKAILNIVPIVIRYFASNKTKQESVDMTDSVWDERREKKDR